MIDFARINHGAILSLISIVAALIIVWWLIKATIFDSESLKIATRAFWTLMVLTAIGFGWYFITLASVNNTPRSVIDRSALQEQTQDINSRSKANK